MNLTAEQRVQRAHVKMMEHQATKAFSSILMVGNTEVSNEIPTACTNGRDVLYGADFIQTLTDPELNAVILHENLHKVYQHHWLWKHLWKEDARLANMSADYVINLEILDVSKKHRDFIQLPESALLEERFRGMDTQKVFNALKDEGGSGGEEGFDEHNFDELTEEEKEELGKEIEQAVRQGALLAGKTGGDQHRAFDELTTPQVDWRDQLREFMSAVATGNDDSTWRRPNRRWIAQDMYMPSTISESMGPLVVGIDTSGSLGERELASFLSEVIGLCNNVSPELLHLIEVDAKVQNHEVFDRDGFGRLASKRSLKGGGGTDMRVIFKHIEDNNIKPEAVIVLTDGETPFPAEVKYPTLWAITSKHITSPVGSTIHID